MRCSLFLCVSLSFPLFSLFSFSPFFSLSLSLPLSPSHSPLFFYISSTYSTNRHTTAQGADREALHGTRATHVTSMTSERVGAHDACTLGTAVPTPAEQYPGTRNHCPFHIASVKVGKAVLRTNDDSDNHAARRVGDSQPVENKG